MTKSNRDLATAEEGFSLISNQKLLSLYTTMLACRRIAEQASSNRKSIASILSHEASVVGVAIDLLPQDTATHTLSPDAAFAAANSSVTKSPSMMQAVRSAADSKSGQITVVFAGGKLVAQPAWRKALALATDKRLPILFVVISGRADSNAEAGELRIPQIENEPSLPLINVDGNDVVAVYRVATEAITHARKGHGPALIDCRLSAASDPIENMRKYLIGKGIDPAA
jgi:TPP-dependent pyruvate/acetoin dehydrogenase alpha subunit